MISCLQRKKIFPRYLTNSDRHNKTIQGPGGSFTFGLSHSGPLSILETEIEAVLILTSPRLRLGLFLSGNRPAGHRSFAADGVDHLTSRPYTGGARRGSRWLFALLISVCAVGPWFVPWPWQQSDEAPTNDPSAIILLAHSQAVTGRAKTARVPGPSATSVQELTATARSGYDVPVSAAAVAQVRTTPGAYQKLGRVAIPRIGLDVTFGEGVYAKALEKGPGHWPGTVLPGQEGNSVLSGHRNTHTAPFKYLNLLRHGDKVVVTVKGRKAVTFRVMATTIVREAKFKDFVLQQPSNPDTRAVTLFACHPEGNPVFRIVVRAEIDRG